MCPLTDKKSPCHANMVQFTCKLNACYLMNQCKKIEKMYIIPYLECDLGRYHNTYCRFCQEQLQISYLLCYTHSNKGNYKIWTSFHNTKIPRVLLPGSSRGRQHQAKIYSAYGITPCQTMTNNHRLLWNLPLMSSRTWKLQATLFPDTDIVL